jgi:anaerobic selenocysteine-containing dehydrogenase
MPDVLAEVAHKMDAGARLEPSFEKEIYSRNFGDLERAWASPEDAPKVWREMLEKGGTWRGSPGNPPSPPKSIPPVKFEEPKFDGEASAYPFHFLPYASQALYDGSLAHLPWLQEMPDPLSTAMWSSWVEINTKTAERLGIRQGDQVEVESQHGKLKAPALVTPAIAPDVIAMPVGQGHTNFTRYASGRGANPISILAPIVVPGTGSLAWAATRVKITKVGEGKLTLFAGEMREHPHEDESR